MDVRSWMKMDAMPDKGVPPDHKQPPEKYYIHWDHHNSLALIDAWHQQSTKKNIKTKIMWQNIAKDLTTDSFQPSWEQAESKWKGLRRTYKKIKDNNNSSGLFVFFLQMH